MAKPIPIDSERRQHECERAMLCRVVRLDGREWVVASVDHLARVGDLRGIVPTAFGPSQSADYSIRNVPIDELAGMTGCSCGLHGWQAPPPAAAAAPVAPPTATDSVLAWVPCDVRMPPREGGDVFWWLPGEWPQRHGRFSNGRFYNDREVGEDVYGTAASEVSHWAPWPSNEPELTVDDGAEDTRG